MLSEVDKDPTKPLKRVLSNSAIAGSLHTFEITLITQENEWDWEVRYSWKIFVKRARLLITSFNESFLFKQKNPDIRKMLSTLVQRG